jgi:hypothetical protein
LNRFHPTVIFEMNRESSARCEQLLRSAGYDLYDLAGSLLPASIVDRCHDVLAVHSRRD